MVQHGHFHQVPGRVWRPAHRELEQVGCRLSTSLALTGIKAQVTGVEVPDQQASTQPDGLEVTVASVQVDQENVVQVELQAGPAGTRGAHICQVCRTGAKVRAYPHQLAHSTLCPQPGPTLMATAVCPSTQAVPGLPPR